jgi:hypothetical protein
LQVLATIIRELCRAMSRERGTTSPGSGRGQGARETTRWVGPVPAKHGLPASFPQHFKDRFHIATSFARHKNCLQCGKWHASSPNHGHRFGLAVGHVVWPLGGPFGQPKHSHWLMPRVWKWALEMGPNIKWSLAYRSIFSVYLTVLAPIISKKNFTRNDK